MKLTVVGCDGAYQSPGGACSSYLLTHGNKNILLDFGNGSLGNLQKIIKIEQIDTIILSHLHSDHMSDMMVLRYAVQIKNKNGAAIKPIDVYAPPSPEEEYARLNIEGTFNLKPISEETKITIDDLLISFKTMKHPILTFAVSIQDKEKRFVYSGDTSWNEELIHFSKDSDVLLLDSGLLSEEKKGENVAHLTARECGVVAKRANAKKLMLTHFLPENDRGLYLAQAKENFDNVQTVENLAEYVV